MCLFEILRECYVHEENKFWQIFIISYSGGLMVQSEAYPSSGMMSEDCDGNMGSMCR